MGLFVTLFCTSLFIRGKYGGSSAFVESEYEWRALCGTLS